MCDYSRGKLYKIYNTITEDIYIGATTLTLSDRMQRHISAHNNIKKEGRKLYKHFKEYGIEHFFIELLEAYNCNSKKELEAKEGEYIRALTPSLNMRIEGRTAKQRNEDNRDVVKAYHKQYYEDNKNAYKTYYQNNLYKIAEQKKQYYQSNKDKSRERGKRYYNNNIGKIAEQKKQYYNFNKERKQQKNIKTV